MLTPYDEEECVRAGPFEVVCILREQPGVFRAVILEGPDIPTPSHMPQSDTIVLTIGAQSALGNLEAARTFAKVFAENHGIEDDHILDFVVSLENWNGSITVYNWIANGGTARDALCRALE